MDGSKSLSSTLAEKNVPHVWHVDSGGHEWPVWKNDLYLLSQMLFQDGRNRLARRMGSGPEGQEKSGRVAILGEVARADAMDLPSWVRLKPDCGEANAGPKWASETLGLSVPRSAANCLSRRFLAGRKLGCTYTRQAPNTPNSAHFRTRVNTQ